MQLANGFYEKAFNKGESPNWQSLIEDEGELYMRNYVRTAFSNWQSMLFSMGSTSKLVEVLELEFTILMKQCCM